MDTDLILRVAGNTTLDLTWVEKLRKDLLTLLKNLPRIQTYREGDQVRKGFVIFKTRFYETLFERFLNKHLKYGYEDYGISESDARYIEKRLRKSGWDLYIDMALPLDFPDNHYMTEDLALARFKLEYPKWEARIKRKAQTFWKDMRETIEWIERQKGKFSVPTPDVEIVAIEGFRVEVSGYSEDRADIMELFKAGLRLYKSQAKSRFPLLLKKQLPLLLNLEPTVDKGGEYHSKGGGEIEFYGSGIIGKTPGRVAHILAHEMGHHLFRTYLGGHGREFWETAIAGNYGEIDVAEIIREWPGDAWVFELHEKLADSNPILALQVQAFTYDRRHTNVDGYDLQKKEEWEALLASGTRTVNVPKIPITGYANKNPEEALCEAIGLLVGYGPAAVHEVIRDWLNIVFHGQVKMASSLELRVVNRFIVLSSGDK